MGELAVNWQSGGPPPRVVVMVPVGGRWVSFSSHAFQRWRERRRPGSEWNAGLHELATLVAQQGAITTRRPRGVELMGMRQKLSTVGWLTLADGTAFPLVLYDGDLVATTCLTGGCA